MTQTPRSSSPHARIGGGGAATSAGIHFQQQLGALFSSWILAGDRFDHSLRLGSAAPEWIRFETEAPVDDLLIKTSDGGYVAVQAKTTVSRSEDLGSPLGKTILQFVRHWFVAQQGDGSMEWNRPLDPTLDRLVLAVSPQASAHIRHDLPAALRLISQPGGGALNQKQQRAYQMFSSLVEQAWASITKTPFDNTLLSELAKLVVVFTFDDDQGSALASGSLFKAFGSHVSASAAFTALSDLSGKLMKDRSGGDLSIWRQLLVSRGIVLDASPKYRTDIEALKQHSRRIADALGSYERIEVPSGAVLSVSRDCQASVEVAVSNGPLLIIGEPGAGKSGVLNALARKLADDGADVLQLAVDRYSIESLEGLSRELGLQHPLLDVLEAWDGAEPAYLVIDALDATRGGHGEGVFRTLIERVLERRGRWNVIASIRNFDLRMGQQLRALFKGTPPESSFADSSFAEVRHIQVPLWSEDEFEQLLQLSPALGTCLAQTPKRLRDLAMVPFNTRLLSELILGGAVKHLDEVASQADLLHLYWDRRVEGHGLPAKSSLSRVVQLMVQSRALRAPILDAASDNPTMIDTLCKEGVLVVVDGERWVQFRHHLLFDYAAARLALDPSTIVSGTYRFRKTDSLGLMLSPALAFVLREIWESEKDHARFWIALGSLINDEDGDPVIRSTAGRLGAEFPISANDCLWLGTPANARKKKVLNTLSHVTGALVVRLEDEKQIELEPWVYLADRLAVTPITVADTLCFLLQNLIERIERQAFRPMLGQAARALLAHGLAQAEPGFTVRSAIGFVVATYDTDVEASRALLTQLFERGRLDRFGHEEVPAVCYKIEAVADVDPEFVTHVYRVVFDYDVTEERQTRIGRNRILGLTSNARQDYGMARWSLGEYLPKFLQDQPQAAVKAVINAVEGYVGREHPTSDEALDIAFQGGGRPIRLREDRSHIWAHDPDSNYDRDAESLVLKLRTHLDAISEAEAVVLIDILIDSASFAILWARMFLCAVERNDALVDILWPIAVTEPFLVLPDTRKDAIDLVAIGFGRRSQQEKEAFERNAFGFDFSRFQHHIEAHQAFLESLFTTIGRDNLVTDEARHILDAKPQEKATTNERLFVIHTELASPDDFSWIEGLNREEPGNSSVIDAINVARKSLELNSKSQDVAMYSLARSLAALESIRTSLADNSPNADLQRHAEAIIGRGCEIIVSRKLLVSKTSPPTLEQDATFKTLLEIAGKSENPELRVDTEAQFEQSAAWGSPAARVEAAQAYWDLFAQRADLYAELMLRAEELLSDRHPAVRLNASVRLAQIWDIDRDRFWKLLKYRISNEPNLTIIEHLVGDVVSQLIHTDQQRSLEILLILLQREAPGSKRQRRLFKSIAGSLTVLWVTYQSANAKAALDPWLSTPWHHAEVVRAVLATLRGAIVAGAGDIPDKSAGLRQRSQALISDIVNATNARLAVHMAAPDLDDATAAEVQECTRLIDTAGMQMFSATSAKNNQQGGDVALGRPNLDVFLEENADLLERIGEYAQPHTTYYMLQLVERLVDVDAGRSFDLASRQLRASRRSGYQHESMCVDLLVQLVGTFLADHKEIFEESARRIALVDCLEVFLESGWPAARRLLYRLPELIQ